MSRSLQVSWADHSTLACVQRFMQKTKAAAFAGWLEGATASAHKREVAVRAAGHFMHQRLGACFLVWRACTQQQLLQQDQLHAALLHWTQGSLGQAFRVWQDWVNRRIDIRIKVAGGSASCLTHSTKSILLSRSALCSSK